ncbi:alpha-galactosidase [Pseudovirgaria hyperparasitica]|uniref:Alpha-galactosidase n=1 Tax=Pseudovirgaria hyperparasitica TaxID=470096 RepID=A0A6A6WK55_9PEZI|nr:alpha-galactosidase [Pseudovirgaria hyperparasitica]KAF2762431.1 alpha-galactosidase [Pseudovirgaria hyperparasitica]
MGFKTTLFLFSACLALFMQHSAAYLDQNGKVVVPAASSYNGLSLTPRMGFNNWNAFHCDVNETLLLSTAKAMVDYGLRDLGYDHIILDDCWSVGRNETGYLVSNDKKFPNGMKYVVDTIHSMGMKFGIYSSAGTFTCGKYPGSLGYEQKDADYWAEIGVDYLKYDNCFNQGQSGTPKLSFDRYKVMSDALNKTGRPIVYAMCNWGNDDPYDWAYDIANSGRMSGDIYDSFNRPDERCPCTSAIGCRWPGFHCSVMNILNKMAAITSRTMSGYFNDMDMLEVGNGGQSDGEYVIHFSMWALHSSPLLIGTNVLTLSPANLAIYANPAVIALNQDPSAGAAVLKWRYELHPDAFGQGEIALWTRGLNNSDQAVALINASDEDMTLNMTLSDILLDSWTAGAYKRPAELDMVWDVYDLWGNRMSESQAGSIINSTALSMPVGVNGTLTRYNATATSYAAGIMNRDVALMGKHVGTIGPDRTPKGTFTADIPRHSLGLYRLVLREDESLRNTDEL